MNFVDDVNPCSARRPAGNAPPLGHSRMSSTPVREAASISITSTCRSSCNRQALRALAAGFGRRAAPSRQGPDAIEGARENAGPSSSCRQPRTPVRI